LTIVLEVGVYDYSLIHQLILSLATDCFPQALISTSS
ncbi:unnamed protein product, partial [marine sediment metagenome]